MLVGTAVWCLCSDETDSVQYHIDYAELYRYETNIIYPPLYAGTCQVSPINGPEDMEGGDFQANVTGVEHYRRLATKVQKSSVFCLTSTISSQLNFWLAVNKPL